MPKQKLRRQWTYEEDQYLQKLVQKFGTKKWTTVAEVLKNKYTVKGRTSKQCRERWHNHLDPNITKQAWSLDEKLILFEFHRDCGNKWSVVANKLPGRTDNSIKNHFYSTIRR
jgi:hypothetical protein